jgi:hypothetical protein
MWFEELVGGPYSERTMVHRLSCAGLSLKVFQYFDVGDGSWAPELYSEGPDGFEDDFIG